MSETMTVDAEIREVIGDYKRGQLRANGGRPTKLRFRRVRKILELLAKGNARTTAAQSCGIAASVFREWCERFPKLEHLATRAENIGVTTLHAKVYDGRDIKGQPDWKASAWLLERRDRQNYAGPKQVEINNHVTNNSLTLTVDAAAAAKLQEAHKAAAQAIIAQRSPMALLEVEQG